MLIIASLVLFISGCGFKAPPYYEKQQEESIKS